MDRTCKITNVYNTKIQTNLSYIQILDTKFNGIKKSQERSTNN